MSILFPLPWYAYLIIALLCAVNWAAAFFDNLKLYYISKPFVLIAMIAFFAHSEGLSALRLPFFIGLVFSLLGDVFLIPQRTRFFVTGMGAFAIAHLAYIYGYTQWRVSYWTYIPAFFALVVLVLAFNFYIETQCKEASLPRFQKRLFKAYGVLVAGMALAGWLCLARVGWGRLPAVMAGLGGSFFMVSDFMIALGKLEKRISRQRFWVIVTYHIAQMLILSSVLMVKPA